MTSPFCLNDPRTIKRHSEVLRRTSSTIAVRRRHTVDVRFKAARVRLFNFVSAGSLTPASAGAYAAGLETLAWSQTPLGLMPPLVALDIHVLEPVAAYGAVVVPVRWQARGQARLPALLDADLSLTAAGQDSTVLIITGTFRLPTPPPGSPPGGRVEPHTAAVACADSLLASVADALTSPVVPPLHY
jgi:hypothetical protein